ncbi:MAG TPA: glycosyltransferase [Methanocella sp.]|nr:glycosyltransferase [Methanocella sp.]
MDISVVIPAFNEEKYIERCLKSLDRQVYGGNYEIIVADDSSSDNTVKIAEKYADRVIVHPRGNISFGRQMGANAAKYPIIAFTDADTHIPSNWLLELASSLEEKGVAGVHGKLMPLDGNRLENRFCEYVLPPYSEFMVKINKPSVPGANFAVTRKAFDNAGGFNTRLVTGEDVELCKRVKEYGRITFNPDAVVYVSTRRIRKWGYLKVVSFHISNTVRLNALNRARAEYEPVR